MREAETLLFEEIIPEFARVLIHDTDYDPTTLSLTDFIQALHREGINVRYLGKVRKRIEETLREKTLEEGPRRQGEQYFLLILIEMVARVTKCRLRELMREYGRGEKSTLPADIPYRKLTVNHLNLLFGTSIEALTYWMIPLPEALIKKFGTDALTPTEKDSLKATVFPGKLMNY